MGKTHHLIRYFNGRRLDVTLEEGRLYEVLPEDPDARSGHAGRICRVEAIEGELVPRKATVRFEDTGRIGVVKIADLVEPEVVS